MSDDLIGYLKYTQPLVQVFSEAWHSFNYWISLTHSQKFIHSFLETNKTNKKVVFLLKSVLTEECCRTNPYTQIHKFQLPRQKNRLLASVVVEQTISSMWFCICFDVCICFCMQDCKLAVCWDDNVKLWFVNNFFSSFTYKGAN